MNVAPEPQVGHATEGPLAGSGLFAGTLKRPGLTSGWNGAKATITHVHIQYVIYVLQCNFTYAPCSLHSLVTVVPQGLSSIVPWLSAWRSTQDCWNLRANSTVTWKPPSSLPLSDTLTRESRNTHFSSSAGSVESKAADNLLWNMIEEVVQKNFVLSCIKTHEISGL